MQKIIIVESPSKSKTIESYMGGDYKVLSSKGHIRDLAIAGKDGLGVDVENDFAPTYTAINEKQKLIKDLQKACKGKEVFLATDPDREGEAISWHLAQVLNLDIDQANRVVFNEITKSAVKAAFEQPRKIDKDLVSSQEARRILDRIIGFKLSKLLQSKINSKSAGRVQSVALKRIVDLDKEIEAFVPEQYFEIHAQFDKFSAELTHHNGQKVELKDPKEAQKHYQALTKDFIVSNIESKVTKRESKPPYTTSTLQQDASNKLGLNSTKTMRLAQALYEGKDIKTETVGLITYMRTDSDRLAESFIEDTKDYVTKTFGKTYVGHKKQKKTANQQDAHEAIRPTSVSRTPQSVSEYLTKDELRLYQLIYQRAVASLMAPAQFDTQKVELKNGEYQFKANGSKLAFDGYLRVFEDKQDDDDKMLPHLTVNQSLTANKVELSEHFTKGPSRFSEARLIKDMEEIGIGRPSTYSQTIQTLKDRGYIEYKEKKFFPTEQGKLTVKSLDEYFSKIINVDYTARMEHVLDEVAQGKEEWQKIIKQFYHAFIPMVEHAKESMEKIQPVITDEVCPNCGSNLVVRNGKYGEFLACGAFPKCRYIKKEEADEPEISNIKCTQCETGYMVKRMAKKGKNAGKHFYACTNFPKCKHTLSEIPSE